MATDVHNADGWWRTMTTALLATAMMASGSTGTAAASTLREADLPSGEFSSDHKAPTRIPAGVDRILGAGGIGSDDYLVLDLSPDTRSITLEFRAPAAIGSSYSAGGVVLFDTEAFAYEWAGTQLHTPILLDHRRRRQSMTIALPEHFEGQLFLALNFTHGEGIAYTLSVPPGAPTLIQIDAREPDVELPGRITAGAPRAGSGATIRADIAAPDGRTQP